jgi:phenylalanyl-tRNA synthetase beta chain
LLDTAVTFAQVEETIKKAERRLLQTVSLFDVYEGKNIPAGKKSYAVAITLQDMEKTLNDKQIDAVMGKIMQALEKNLGAQLR